MICPNCGENFPDDETCWLVQGRFYCSEKCARVAVKLA